MTETGYRIKVEHTVVLTASISEAIASFTPILQQLFEGPFNNGHESRSTRYYHVLLLLISF